MSNKQRKEIKQIYKWNIEDMYADEQLWQQDIDKALEFSKDFVKFDGKIAENSHTLLEALTMRDDIWQLAEKPYVYARMRKDEDNRVEKYQSMCDKAQSVLANISANMSFFVPQLLGYDKKYIDKLIADEPQLAIYTFMLDDLFREQSHILSQDAENILAQMSEITPATNNIFTMLNNADIKFGNITSDGSNTTLTHGNYITFMESSNRDVRKEAYEKMYAAYRELINTIATTYNYNTKTDTVIAKLRKYTSSRNAALSGDNVSEEVYDNLVSTVNDALPTLHKYINIRKKILGVDELKMYDVYTPLIDIPQKDYTFDDAKNIMTDALSVLGEDYIKNMQNGLKAGWVDVYENEGKTSGAYSFGSYDSMPYILMNFSHTLKDVFTLTHEMGHSMHSYYTRKAQPFIYGSHSIFTAEVASTVNENLLMKYLIANEKDIEMKKYLLNYHIEEFRTTLFRQTMFAEFEHWTHKMIEDGNSLTADNMCEYYDKLNKKYFGDAIADDEWIKYEWARIPHFYNAFYVYKYATGYSAATAISDIILKDGPDNYLEFLKTGESDYPIELLKIAGVDMSKPEPIKQAMKVFAELVDEFEKLILE